MPKNTNISDDDSVYEKLGLFFNNPKDCMEKIELLRDDSSNYDAEYEKKARNQELNIVYFLGEVVSSLHNEDNNLTYLLLSLEDSLLSAKLYNVDTDKILEQIKYELENNISIFIHNISAGEYNNYIQLYSASSMPKTKAIFIDNLKWLASKEPWKKYFFTQKL